MFSTILAYIVFIFTALVLIAALYHWLRPRSDLEKAMEDIQAYRRGYRNEPNFWKVLAFFVVWAATGIYLFG